MELYQINPLDQSPIPGVPAILIHTDSYIEEIKSGEKQIGRLLKIASLDTTDIVFTPTSDLTVQHIFRELELDLASYYLQNNQYIFQSRYKHAGFSYETDEELVKEFLQDKGYTLNDSMLMRNRYFHYHLSRFSQNSTPIDKILDVLQVFHVKNRIFKSDRNTEIGQFFYDLVSRNKQLPAYQALRGEFTYIKAAFPDRAEVLEDLLQSLNDRMILMNKSVIELKYHSLKTVNNNASTEVMYHLSYFVVLVTGVFDNIAWMLNYFYDLGFSLEHSNRTKVKLQNTFNPSNKPTESYYINLFQKAPVISTYLLSEKISCLIDFIYPLRDAIQHRSFIKPLTVSRVSSKIKTPTRLLIQFPRDVRGILQRSFSPVVFGFDKDTSDSMKRDYFDIYVFSTALHAEIIEMLNTLCTMVDLGKIVPISQELQNKITNGKENYEINPFVGLRVQDDMAY
jgi:hypothetical protein